MVKCQKANMNAAPLPPIARLTGPGDRTVPKSDFFNRNIECKPYPLRPGILPSIALQPKAPSKSAMIPFYRVLPIPLRQMLFLEWGTKVDPGGGFFLQERLKEEDTLLPICHRFIIFIQIVVLQAMLPVN